MGCNEQVRIGRGADGVWQLEAEQVVARPLDEVFRFFSVAGNLPQLTPGWLAFKILTPGVIGMKQGTLIEYEIRLMGVPLWWQTRIEAWEPPTRFVDVQLRGPYALWEHEHRFEAVDGGTRVSDRVRYIPRGGAVVNRLFVQPSLRRIFAYRQRQMQLLFPPEGREKL